MTRQTIVSSVFIKSEPQNVWLFLVDKDKLGEWYHPASNDLVVGQDYPFDASVRSS
ncbi:hypothetical protein [Octadecabacter ascidiaceicola]|uniref:Activator of Hsp90 ATPase homolog 1-like protein n=1 Tax=Octadecabacter ascidiaceicola TaxID=1655543 RepID=A0A238K1L7_9RHOB|nr:hypothetical protein [Octadecabacter ascidiaceicola]SMX36798.1 hypothetical protein OCA8868_01108 [Octadecabacter ascidiaceicola]